jgi:hypothetical protein
MITFVVIEKNNGLKKSSFCIPALSLTPPRTTLKKKPFNDWQMESTLKAKQAGP